MDVYQLVQAVAEKYKTDIRPAIEKKDYDLAHLAMASLNLGIRNRGEEIMGRVHCGISFLGHALLLEDKLREGNAWRIKWAQNWFEVYCAQTKLSTA